MTISAAVNPSVEVLEIKGPDGAVISQVTIAAIQSLKAYYQVDVVPMVADQIAGEAAVHGVRLSRDEVATVIAPFVNPAP